MLGLARNPTADGAAVSASADHCTHAGKQESAAGAYSELEEEANSTNWSYVGPGRGGYEVVEVFNFVGSQKGDFEKEGGKTSNLNWRSWHLGIAMLCAALVIAAMFLFQGYVKADDAQAEADMQVTKSARQDSAFSSTTQVRSVTPVPASQPALHNCQDGLARWEKGWSTSKKTWCCVHGKFACDPWDCTLDFQTWRTSWTVEKQGWCCQFKHIGCTTTTTTPSPSFDCSGGGASWEKGWASDRRAWCCVNRKTACDPWDCDFNMASWGASWSDEKKGWCCLNKHVGCTTTPSLLPPAQLAATCSADCSYNGQSHTCGERIQFAAAHQFVGRPDACNAAQMLVVSECWFCSGCPLSATGCAAPLVTTTAPPACDSACTSGAETHTCVERIRFAAAKHFVGRADACEAARSLVSSKCSFCSTCYPADVGCVLPAPAAPPTTRQPYDCSAGFGEWQHGWSPGKKKWCCHRASRGCTPSAASLPFDCQAGLAKWERGWSDSKKAWCCEHFGLGCTTTTTTCQYDCRAGLSNWNEGWSDQKKQWCCEHSQVGCPVDVRKK